MTPTFFERPAEFARWLATHHRTSRELLVGFHKTKSGRDGVTYREALDLALAYGWIDGVRKGLVRRADRKAFAYFNAQPPGYRKLSAFRVMSAKREETRARRLAHLIACSRAGVRTDVLVPRSGSATRRPR